MGRIVMYVVFFLGASLRWSFKPKEKSLRASIEEMRLVDAIIGLSIVAVVVLWIKWAKGHLTF